MQNSLIIDQRNEKTRKESDENSSARLYFFIISFVLLIFLFYFIGSKFKSKKIVAEINENSMITKNLDIKIELKDHLNGDKTEHHIITRESLQTNVKVSNNNDDVMSKRHLNELNNSFENSEANIVYENNENLSLTNDNSSLTSSNQTLNSIVKITKSRKEGSSLNTKLFEAQKRFSKITRQVLEKLKKAKLDYDNKLKKCLFFKKLNDFERKLKTICNIIEKGTWTSNFINDKVSILQEFEDFKDLYLKSDDLKKSGLLEDLMNDLDELMPKIKEMFDEIINVSKPSSSRMNSILDISKAGRK